MRNYVNIPELYRKQGNHVSCVTTFEMNILHARHKAMQMLKRIKCPFLPRYQQN